VVDRLSKGLNSESKPRELKSKLRACRDGMSSDKATRLHRAISWLTCVQSHTDEDVDLSFLTLWIAFNSCYAIDDGTAAEHSAFIEFTSNIKALDKDDVIYNCLW
jgi:hypothetical protein